MSGHARHDLPQWGSVLAVVAHPDDESFGLGAVLTAFADADADVVVLCLTHGEASTLHGVAGDLHRIRAQELAAAGEAIGVRATVLRSYPDGALASVCRSRLVGEVIDVVRSVEADGLVAFDPSGVTGHPDHTAATTAALAAADLLDLPVLGWTLPDVVADTLNEERKTTFTGHPAEEVDYVVRVDRTRQRAAAAVHVSQALPTNVLWRRLDLLGDLEHLCGLRSGSDATPDRRSSADSA